MSDAEIMTNAEILCETRGGMAFITLNRPAALNALSLDMIAALRDCLRRCAADPQVRALLLRGAGEKAFCAGGDIRALFESFRDSGSLHREFFAAEYALDYLLYSFPKPYVVLLDGITMGGGMGLAQSSTRRIVGERTRMAMPEVGIRLFPDVGGCYCLSRLPGSLGTYLALTGAQIRGVDALYAKLADIYLAPPAVASLSDDLSALAWSADPAADLERFFALRKVDDPPAAPLSTMRAAVDEHFSKPSVAAILASLDAEQRAEFTDWARQTAKTMRARSPTMMSVALRQIESGKSLSLADCFRMELGMINQCFEQGDFIEGVRALIIDKDNSPRWSPARLDDVTPESVAAFFRERWHGAAHPLAELEKSALHVVA